MSKAIKFKNNIYLDTSGITHNNKVLKDILTPTPIDTGYITPNSGTRNVGNLSQYERLLVVLSANGSHTTVEVPKDMYGWNIGANWQAVDNRIATYYCTFKIEANGNITIIYSGYSFNTTNSDYPREYGISKIYGYKY